ncbi:MAG: miniconductance mechanosensitive channel [Cellvibrionaceae bacterium]|jgi:miniconductance mechanosensitive channel
MFDFVFSILTQNGTQEGTAWFLALISGLIIVLIICAVARNITERVLNFVTTRFVRKNAFDWDDYLYDAGVLSISSYIVPVVVFRAMIPFAFDDHWYASIPIYVEKAIGILLIIIIAMAFNRMINAIRDYALTLDFSKHLPIVGFVQLSKVILFVGVVILVYSASVGQPAATVLVSFGAFAAILSFIYQDALRGLVAGIQLTWNGLLATGDWIEMPSFNVGGTVTEIGLTTVKVQNFDYSVTAIPTYALVSDALKNWKGMQEAAGRRMIRSLIIDVNSIRFCDEQLLTQLKTLTLIEPYITGKEAAIEAHNHRQGVNEGNSGNGRQQTNIGIFRRYFLAYLRRHPKIVKDMTLVVRQLEPTEHGMPIQLYAFCTEKAMPDFENVQSDIFDHILAILPQFDLRIFQYPSGPDIRELKPDL